jgi:hypothetical protein
MGPGLSSILQSSSFHLLIALSSCHTFFSQFSSVVLRSADLGPHRIPCVIMFPHLPERPFFSIPLQVMNILAALGKKRLLNFHVSCFICLRLWLCNRCVSACVFIYSHNSATWICFKFYCKYWVSAWLG